MLTVLRTVLLASTGLAISACASLEPEPCTAEWVDWKKTQVLNTFARQHTGDIRFVRELAGSFDREQSAPQVLLRLATAGPRVQSLVEDFVDLAVPAVQTAVAQCGSAPRASQLFADMLRDEGVDEKTLEWIETLGVFFDQTAAD
ncbi:hypothetical protein GC169_03115 [bacterium]|nr:hypothetical protein [bacterium]